MLLSTSVRHSMWHPRFCRQSSSILARRGQRGPVTLLAAALVSVGQFAPFFRWRE